MPTQEVNKAKFVTLLSAAGNFIMSIIKMITGHFGHSQSLFIDGVHSLSDLITDAFVYWGAHIGSLPPDDNHPYGHQRIETLVMILMAILIVIVGGLFGYEAIIDFGRQTQPVSLLVLIVAFCSILVNEGLYRVTVRVGQSINSSLIISNAIHHRSDSLSSAVVLVGALGSLQHIYWLDSVAAIIVSMMIIKLGASLIIEGMNELIDTAADGETSAQVTKLVENYPCIKKIHALRTRSMAKRILIDLELIFEHNITLNEATFIKKQLLRKIMAINPLIHYVTISFIVDHANAIYAYRLEEDYRKKIMAHLEATTGQSIDTENVLINFGHDEINVTLLPNGIGSDISITDIPYPIKLQAFKASKA